MSVAATVHVFLIVTIATALKYTDHDAATRDHRSLVTSTAPSLSHLHDWFSKLQRSRKIERAEKLTLLPTGQQQRDPLNSWTKGRVSDEGSPGETSDNSLTVIGNRESEGKPYAREIGVKKCLDSRGESSWNDEDYDRFDRSRNAIRRTLFVRSHSEIDHRKEDDIIENRDFQRQIEGRRDDSGNDGESYYYVSSLDDNSNVRGRRIAESGSNSTSQEENDLQNFLDRLKKKVNGEELASTSHRQGRRRKLTSQQQGTLLVEALRKKRNYTGDHRGHNDLQNGLMDMLGRSTFRVKRNPGGGDSFVILFLKSDSSLEAPLRRDIIIRYKRCMNVKSLRSRRKTGKKYKFLTL